MFFFQAEDGIRDLVRSRGLGDVYKRQVLGLNWEDLVGKSQIEARRIINEAARPKLRDLHPDINSGLQGNIKACLLYTSDAADERSSVDLGGRRIIKKKKKKKNIYNKKQKTKKKHTITTQAVYRLEIDTTSIDRTQKEKGA